MIERLLPASVAVAETRADLDDPLYPAERSSIERAVEKRRREFITGRGLARAALAQLGAAPGPIPSGPRGEPIWPAGFAGAITHCAGYRGAAVARTSEVVSLGIDAEPHLPLPEGILPSILATPGEHAWVLGGGQDVCRDRLLFCAKESVYKAWYPLTRRWLGFEEAEVTFAPAGDGFAARLLVPGPVVGGQRLTTLEGRWRVEAGLILVGLALTAA